MADSIFHNGDIITMVDGKMEAEAVAVQNQKIIAVGALVDVMATKQSITQMIDLEGSTLLPGLIEPHTHPILSSLDSFGYANMGAFEPGANAKKSWANVKEKIQKTPKGDWVHVNGMNPMLIEGLKTPTRAFLDSLSTEHPVTVMAVHVHTLFCNSLAYKLAGLEDNTASEEDGFMKDETGALNGQVNEAPAITSMLKHMPTFTRSQGEDFLRKQTKVYAKNGYTTIAATGLFPHFDEGLDVANEVFSDVDCPVRLKVYYRDAEGKEYILDKNDDRKKEPEVLGVKFWADGSPYAGTMAIDEPYLDTEFSRDVLKFAPYPNNGVLNFGFDDLYKDMLPYHLKGLQIATHAHGERAIDQALGVYAKLLGEHPREDHRHRMEHCGLITREQLVRSKQLGVTVSFYPDHIHYYGRTLRDDLLGEERAKRFMPIKMATDVGVRWTLHSDTPCCPLGPMRVLKTVTTRAMRNLPGETHHTLGEDQVVDIDLALRGYTTVAAWQIFQEDSLGSLEIGKFADFTIISQNPRKADKVKLDEIRIMSTYKSGTKVTTD